MKDAGPRITVIAWDSGRRADALIIPVVVRRGKARLSGRLKIPPAAADAAERLAARLPGACRAGAVDGAMPPRGGPFAWVVVVSVGETPDVGMDHVRVAAAAAQGWCGRHGARNAIVSVDALTDAAGDDAPGAWAEGVVLGSYRFDSHRSAPPDDAPIVQTAQFLAVAAGMRRRVESSVKRAVVRAECANLARDIAHEPANVVQPRDLAARARILARRHGLRCRVLDERQLERLNMRAMLAVGRGSAAPPRLIVLEHKPPRSSGRPIALVGKGLTYDTGGYSLKPTSGMADMKYDKCGAVAVIGALIAAARLKLPKHVVGVIGAAENMISGRAYRPGDILRAANGKTIEVMDTDAEGRLVLADCLHYAEMNFRPAMMIDLATLTGACSIALGEECAGLFATDDRLGGRLREAGERTNERLWQMPMWPKYRERIVGTDADLKNVGGRPGGAITAAMFLKEFVTDKTPWAHLDIAGVASVSKPTPMCPIGATGFGVRLLVEFLESL